MYVIVSPGIDLRLLFIFPSHRITLSIIIFIENYIVSPVPMHECLAGKCEVQLGLIMCPG
jgi:hypothetical protein